MSRYKYCSMCMDTGISHQTPNGSVICPAIGCRARRDFNFWINEHGVVERMTKIPWREPLYIRAYDGHVLPHPTILRGIRSIDQSTRASRYREAGQPQVIGHWRIKAKSQEVFDRLSVEAFYR